MLESLKKEIEKEIEASQVFLKLAIASQKLGHTHAATFFLNEAKEDIEHAFEYAVQLDKHDGLGHISKSITDITKEYKELEEGAIVRLTEMENKTRSANKISTIPFINKMIEAHSDEAYKAKKLLAKISILDEQEAVKDIDELFEELS
ncbi:MAG: ferritin-like domain-containing protein [Brevinema sp.]